MPSSFLRRLRRGEPAPDGAPGSSAAGAPASLQWFLEALQGHASPSVLDLGVGPERQLMNLVSLGFRVTADDTAVARLQKIACSADEDLFQIAEKPQALFSLDLPGESFDGVLAWSSFDRLSYLGGFLLGHEIARLCREGAVVTGTWSAAPRRRQDTSSPGAPLVLGEGIHPMRFPDPTPCRYENKQILDLFPGFVLVHSIVYVDGSRRMLLAKHPDEAAHARSRFRS